MRYGEVRCSDEDLAAFADAEAGARAERRAPGTPGRINLDPEKVHQGLGQLVLSLVELIRQLVEKQALRRIEGGDLAPAQVEQLGQTLMRLSEEMERLKRHFDIEDLNLDLGPLGRLLD